MNYFICGTCFKWSQTPQGFDERKHFVRCTCNSNMLLTNGTPKEDAMPERDEIQGTVVSQ